MLDRWGGRATKIAVGVFIVFGVLAVQRAGERELSARVQIMPGYAGIEVLEGADQLRAIYPALQAEKKPSFLSGLSPVSCVEYCVTEYQSQICNDSDCKLGSDCSVLPENCFEACSPEVLAAVLGWNQESRESAVRNP